MRVPDPVLDGARGLSLVWLNRAFACFDRAQEQAQLAGDADLWRAIKELRERALRGPKGGQCHGEESTPGIQVSGGLDREA